ncbi:MAG: response regulator [Spirochaetales bacterium]|nr:response regulator [Spirochaetales bacterium]
MKHILLLDDDTISLSILKKVLEENQYAVTEFTDPRKAIHEFKNKHFDIVISDYYMPEMDGESVLKAVRRTSETVPFLFITVNSNLENAIQLIKKGADDYITKPIIPDDVIFRVGKALRERENSRVVAEVERERELINLEKEKLVRWKDLYAAKDIHQTEQMISLLSRTINQAGGFLWLDLLENDIAEVGEDKVQVTKSVIDLALDAGRKQKEVFDYITFVSELGSMSLNTEQIKLSDFFKEMENAASGIMKPLMEKHNREPVLTTFTAGKEEYHVEIDMQIFKDVLHELFVNAIKFSPEKSRVILLAEVTEKEQDNPQLVVTVRNTPRRFQAQDQDGNKIIGIPYDYSELVFDLFYTIDAFPTNLEEEKWRDGTGLYVCRKLLGRQDSWISARNGLVYLKGEKQVVVNTTVTLPLRTLKEDPA